MHLHKKDTPETTGQRIQWHLHQVHDGLSMEHLKSLLPRNTEAQITAGLRWLKVTEAACLSNNGWWYSLTDTQLLAPDLSIQPPEPLPMNTSRVAPVSVADRLCQWLENRTPEDAPILLVDLAVLLASNTNTLNRAIKKLSQDKPELAEPLKAAILRKPSIIPAKAAEPELSITSADDWVTELKQQLMTPCLPEETRVQWRETLWQLDSVLKELGVADEQRSRTHLREIHDWLNF